MVTGCQDILNESISELFTPQLNHETQLINERNNKIVSLNESQKVLNQKISEISNLKNMAEENSLASNSTSNPTTRRKPTGHLHQIVMRHRFEPINQHNTYR